MTARPAEQHSKPATVDEYVGSFPPDVQRSLEDVRRAIRAAVPEADERISYGIPTFAIGGRYVVYFSGWKEHLSVYPIPDGDSGLAAELEPYRAGKGTLKFPLSKLMPLELITRISARLLEQHRARRR
jgi:uncharacterized protein YdhG (YjbR/CyaY superfamily)